MRAALAEFRSALSYFTVLPVGRLDAEGAPSGGALAYLPIVGALVGLIAGGSGALVALGVRWLAAPVVLLASLIVTGAIHVDGLLDAADALCASVTVERRFEIARDPQHGTYAIVAMTVTAIFWLLALAHIPPPALIAATCAAATIGRCGAIVNAWFFPYARGGTLMAGFQMHPNPAIVMVGFLIGVMAAYLTTPWLVVAALIVPLAAPILGLFAARRLGGALNGDCYGAIAVIGEVGMLVAAAILLR